MTPARFQRISELLLAAREHPSEQRDAFLRQECHNDDELYEEVQSLLAVDDGETPSQERGHFGFSPNVADIDKLLRLGATAGSEMPERVGNFSIIQKIGEGGMGVVYKARQETPHRLVALKLMRTASGSISDKILHRFQREIEVHGHLQHPGITHLYEAGVAEVVFPGGRTITQPYLGMEYIRGEPLKDFARSQKLGLRARMELMVKVCEAVHYAHEQRVIHRDLKPGNILVDETGQPKVLDFGVARATDADLLTVTMQTDVGQLIGTVPYMSPEQVTGDVRAIDARSDVYSLGVVLYELLADRLPHDVRHCSIPEAVRAIREDDPTPLSSIHSTYRGDVATIVAKALEKEKSRRYQSAEELAADIRRYLHDEPIVARPASTTYQLRKFALRHRGLTAGLAATFIVLVIGIIVSLVLMQQARSAEHLARQRLAAAEALTKFLTDAIQKVSPSHSLGREITLRETLDDAAKDIDEAFRDQPLIEATLRTTIGVAYHALGSFDEAESHLRKAVELRRANQSAVSAGLPESLEKLGGVLTVKGQFDRAEQALNEALSLSLQHGGEQQPQVAQIRNELGIVYYRKKDYPKAEKETRDALKILETIRHKDDSEIASLKNNLAAVLFDKGDHQAAIELHREVLAIRRRTLGDDHPETALSLYDLAVSLVGIKDFAAAEPLHQEALEIRRRVLPKEHIDIAHSLLNMGRMYLAKGDVNAAAPLMKEAQPIFQAQLGPTSIEAAQCLHELSALLYYQGDFPEAERIGRLSIKAHHELPTEAKELGFTLLNLASILKAQGEKDELVQLYREVLATWIQVVGEKHALIAMTKHYLAEALLWAGKDQQAELLFREAFEMRKELLGDRKPATLMSQCLLGLLTAKNGNVADGEAALAGAVEVLPEVIGENRWVLGYAKSALGEFLMSQNRLDEAEANLQDANSLLQTAPPEQRLIVEEAQRRLASLHARRAEQKASQ